MADYCLKLESIRYEGRPLHAESVKPKPWEIWINETSTWYLRRILGPQISQKGRIQIMMASSLRHAWCKSSLRETRFDHLSHPQCSVQSVTAVNLMSAQRHSGFCTASISVYSNIFYNLVFELRAERSGGRPIIAVQAAISVFRHRRCPNTRQGKGCSLTSSICSKQNIFSHVCIVSRECVESDPDYKGFKERRTVTASGVPEG